MKKRLFLLPLIGGFVLSGCTFTIFGKTITLFEKEGQSENEEKKEDKKEKPQPKEIAADITINYDTLSEFFDEGFVYPQSDYEFTAGGVKFNATSGVGQKTANSSGGNYYNEQHALQFRKQGHEKGAGVITVAEPIIATKITIHWLATYASEATKYQPVVKVGEDEDSITTNVSCNEGSTVNGTKTDGKEGEYDAYDYTTTYNLSGKNYFLISAPGYAMYVRDIVINK